MSCIVGIERISLDLNSAVPLEKFVKTRDYGVCINRGRKLERVSQEPNKQYLTCVLPVQIY